MYVEIVENSWRESESFVILGQIRVCRPMHHRMFTKILFLSSIKLALECAKATTGTCGKFRKDYTTGRNYSLLF